MVKFPQKLEDLYPAGTIEKMFEALQQPDISGKVRDALEKVGLKDSNPLEQVHKVWNKAKDWVDAVAFESASARAGHSSIINATGMLFHDDFAQLPSNPAACRAFSKVAESFHLQSVLESQVNHIAEEALGGLAFSFQIGIAAAIESLANGRKVVVAKCDLLRVPGMGDLSALLSRCECIEIGAVNGCAKEDWMSAAASDVCFLLLSPNAHTAQNEQFRNNAVEASRECGAVLFELAIDATLNDDIVGQCGFTNPLNVIEQGVTAVIAPLGLLIGAPTGAVVLSDDRSLIEQLERDSKMRSTQLTGAAHAAAAVAVQANRATPSSGELNGMLLANPENLQNRAERLAGLIRDNGICGEVEVVEKEVGQGPSPWEGVVLKNWVIQAAITERAPVEIAQLLNDGEPLFDPVSAAQSELESDEDGETPVSLAQPRILTNPNKNSLDIDLRFVDPKDDHRIAVALAAGSFDLEN